MVSLHQPEHLYSLAILPPAAVIREVAGYKLQLADAIGWYPSKNAVAHLTLTGFQATRSQLRKIESFTETVCRDRAAFEGSFDRFGTFSNGAFFFAPDPVSRLRLSTLMQAFQTGFPGTATTGAEPHLTVARRLDAPRLSKATSLFPERIAFSFWVDGVVLRRFNRRRGQYDPVRHFPFNDKPYQPVAGAAVQRELF